MTRPTGVEFGFHRISNLPYLMGEQELSQVLGDISDATLCGETAIDLVGVLTSQGRRKEALHYARRLRAFAPGYAALHPNLRRDLAQMMLGLMPRVDPCVCGSGAAYRRCCGALANWSVV